jgi:asparaginyl-tRNA synthetase
MSEDLKFLEGRLLDEENQNHSRKKRNGFVRQINFVLENNFKRVSYTEALTF